MLIPASASARERSASKPVTAKSTGPITLMQDQPDCVRAPLTATDDGQTIEVSSVVRAIQ